MDVWMHGWMHGCMDGCMDAWMEAWMHGWMHGWMDACMHAWMHACMDGCMDRCMDGWMKCVDFKCVRKPTKNWLGVTHHANKFSRWAIKTLNVSRVRGISPVGEEKVYGANDLPKSQVLSSDESGDSEDHVMTVFFFSQGSEKLRPWFSHRIRHHSQSLSPLRLITDPLSIVLHKFGRKKIKFH